LAVAIAICFFLAAIPPGMVINLGKDIFFSEVQLLEKLLSRSHITGGCDSPDIHVWYIPLPTFG